MIITAALAALAVVVAGAPAALGLLGNASFTRQVPIEDPTATPSLVSTTPTSSATPAARRTPSVEATHEATAKPTAKPTAKATATRGAEPGDDLSDREREVLALVAHGLANKQIATRLGITERTVKVHLGSVLRRIGVADRTSAALWAREHL